MGVDKRIQGGILDTKTYTVQAAMKDINRDIKDLNIVIKNLGEN